MRDRKIKVIQVITRLEAGGSAANTLACARRLKESMDCLLACGAPDAPEARLEAASGARLLAVEGLKRSIDPSSDARAFLSLLGLLRREAPDIVHTHTSKAGALGRWAAWAYNRKAHRPCRVVHTPHGHVLYGYFGPLRTRAFAEAERLSARVTDRLVALSEGEREESLRAGIGAPDQWSVIPSGIDVPPPRELDLRRRSGKAIRERLGFAPDGIVVGTVARLEPVKGVDVLVAAAPVILEAAPGVRFLIVGDGSRRESLEGLARKLGVSDRMVFAGHQGSPLDWMSAMDVYAQPSVNEGLGRALIEAAVLGLPAAASAVCGIPDVVADGRTGLLSPPGDPVALARSILRLASDPGLRGSMGEQARLRVLRPDENGLPFFSSQAMIRKLEGLYASLRPAP